MIKVSMVLDTERTLAALDVPDKAAALVTLARLYARAIDEADGSQNALKEMGPKLATVLGMLGAGKGLAAEVPAAGVPESEVPGTGDPVADEVAAMRRRRAGGPA